MTGSDGQQRCPWCRMKPGDVTWLVDGHQPGCPQLRCGRSDEHPAHDNCPGLRFCPHTIESGCTGHGDF